jgi:hypothetical protein
VILVCDRRAEQRKNAVAGRLDDIAVVVMHRVDHQLQRRVDDRASFLRVEVLHQFHRPLDVGEQRRDCLALAVEPSSGRLPQRDTNIGSSRCNLR